MTKIKSFWEILAGLLIVSWPNEVIAFLLLSILNFVFCITLNVFIHIFFYRNIGTAIVGYSVFPGCVLANGESPVIIKKRCNLFEKRL